MDTFGLISSIIQGVTGVGQGAATIKAAQIAARTQKQALQSQENLARTQFDQQQQLLQQQQSFQAQQSMNSAEVAALFALGAGAVVIAGLFLYSGLKSKKR